MKMIKRMICAAVAATVSMGLCACGGSGSSGTSNSDSSGGLDMSKFPLYNEQYNDLTYSAEGYTEALSQPYFLGNIIYNELALPIAYENGNTYAQLLYNPLKVISVMDQKLVKTYQEGTDYTIDADNGRLVIPTGSSIPTFGEKEEEGKGIPEPYKYSASPDNHTLYTIWNLGAGDFVYTESALFYGRYLSVTYAYDVADVDRTVFSKYDKTSLYNVRAKLEAGEDITLAVLGDSISAGSSSTGDNLDVEPYTHCYASQLKEELERVYNVNVNLINSAKGGSTSDYPLTEAGSTAMANVVNGNPDLCIIAYGMNDSTAQPVVSGTYYKSNIETMLLRVKAASPDCDFILVNSFPCNPKYEREEGVFDKYLAKLNSIASENDDGSVVVVDMHKVGEYFLKSKHFCEISSSNVNHPNDFMHRVYAMNLMYTIFNYAK